MEPRLQLHGLLLDQLRQQRYDGLPQEHHAEHRVQRQRQPHAQDGHHVPGRLRHQGEQTDHLVGQHLARPPLLANVLLVDSVRRPPQLELQHRRQGRIAGRPQIRQEPVDVRQHVLMHGVSPENARLP